MKVDLLHMFYLSVHNNVFFFFFRKKCQKLNGIKISIVFWSILIKAAFLRIKKQDNKKLKFLRSVPL